MTKDNMMDFEDDEEYVYILVGHTNYKWTTVIKVFNDYTLAVEAAGICESVKPNLYKKFDVLKRKVSTSFEGQDELELINMVKDY